ncbi:papain-family cysteine protease [Theileria orientalis strain Shintoku]|uniref:Papain-family cysteine protease n=1 Tax=Theileria orientalis strain Shintoku TaxID=869250 RepID=J4DQ73_THEOR|nr:papain-family cysteine protease [Theileria orientalis strain Shintoku]BAM41954.1 papain-family cysteine protease [Theileria orientalis strain Shintoku]|eukprot:XP_009692255.1 papain-family cysteine protease [Theileria orientalis strain Shintoku]
MVRPVFILGLISVMLVGGYKHSFNIHLSLVDDNGSVRVSSAKVMNSDDEKPKTNETPSKNEQPSYNGYSRSGNTSVNSGPSYGTYGNRNISGVSDLRKNDAGVKGGSETASRSSIFGASVNRYNSVTPLNARQSVTPSTSNYGRSSTAPTVAKYGKPIPTPSKTKPSFPRVDSRYGKPNATSASTRTYSTTSTAKPYVTPSFTRPVNRSTVPTTGTSTSYSSGYTNNQCIMNRINCSLTGVSGEKMENCLSCANLIYHSKECDKYEPSSFLSLFSKNDHKPSLNRQAQYGNSDSSSLLEVTNVDDFKSEGLVPLNIEPKVSVHELLNSYDNQNHVRPRDPYCNDVRCVRLLDPESCISKLPAQNQYTCGSCWIFANTLHLEILMCMESKMKRVRKLSEMYISSCLTMSSRDACSGGNTYHFSQIISQFQFIPSKDDLKYDVPVMNTCPRWQSHWSNQKPNIELLSPENNKLNSFRGFILIKRHEYDSSEEFINLIKDMVKDKGSAVISMRGQSVLKPDHDGKKVLKLCHHNQGTHAMVIIGYGSYFDENSEKRRYWNIRNSWGPNWGDEGNFKLDMDGPDGCNGNVFEYAVVLNVKIHKNSDHANYGYLPDKISNLGSGKTKKISVKFNDKVYSRIFFEDEGGSNSPYDCNRVFSINKNKNQECVNKCKRNLKLCKGYGPKDIGACLFSIDHDYDCMMCGV